jgi:probable rRNA maturation factor
MSRGQPGELNVRICDDAEIARLHLRAMGQGGPTDVLSFPGGTLPGLEHPVLGDIIVSWDAVVRQSGDPSPAAWLEEATQLIIHGLAHLHGHDHATRAQGRAMLRAERRAARAARVGSVTRPYG